MIGATGQGQLVPLSSIPADAGLLPRKQCELDKASRRTYGCWSRQKDHMGLWATETPHPSCVQELLDKVQWKTLGRRAGIQAFPSQQHTVLRALISFSSVWPSTLTLLYVFWKAEKDLPPSVLFRTFWSVQIRKILQAAQWQRLACEWH